MYTPAMFADKKISILKKERTGLPLKPMITMRSSHAASKKRCRTPPPDRSRSHVVAPPPGWPSPPHLTRPPQAADALQIMFYIHFSAISIHFCLLGLLLRWRQSREPCHTLCASLLWGKSSREEGQEVDECNASQLSCLFSPPSHAWCSRSKAFPTGLKHPKLSPATDKHSPMKMSKVSGRTSAIRQLGKQLGKI